MIMGDGAVRNEGVLICTDNFTVKEVVVLINIFIIKFGLDCTIHYDNDYPRIYISKKSMSTLRNLVEPFFIPSMLYKLEGKIN